MEKDYGKKFGKMIAEKIEDLDITQTKCAHKLNIQQSTLSQYVNAKRVMDFNTAMHISQVLDLGLERFFEYAYTDYVMSDAEYIIITKYRELDARAKQDFNKLVSAAFSLSKK